MKAASIVATCVLALSPAIVFGSGCPKGKEGPTPFKPITESSGSLDVQIYSQTDLGSEAIKAEGWRFRARTIVFGKDAVAPLHSHDKRPETAVMKHGSVTVYEQNCTVSYEMKEGDVYQSGHGDAHWVVNTSGAPAVMFVVDLVNEDSFPGSHDKM
ncbi:cupin domain-containing protein [Pseudomonas segetis]|uniref:Cupin domain-containing protein n=1 Tax=Pseudomonas segetis TaxID=298908 RepID=A0A238ZR99_9PSED|nr:cupin domain-containing protein [Pseudomonas segetis]SNR85234.1 Cupin domain-containing protein [Pseudomonas segetis]